jgi:hypothetical protein
MATPDSGGAYFLLQGPNFRYPCKKKALVIGRAHQNVNKLDNSVAFFALPDNTDVEFGKETKRAALSRKHLLFNYNNLKLGWNISVLSKNAAFIDKTIFTNKSESFFISVKEHRPISIRCGSFYFYFLPALEPTTSYARAVAPPGFTPSVVNHQSITPKMTAASGIQPLTQTQTQTQTQSQS